MELFISGLRNVSFTRLMMISSECLSEVNITGIPGPNHLPVMFGILGHVTTSEASDLAKCDQWEQSRASPLNWYIHISKFTLPISR
jgi:hypothetical protein